MEKIMAQCTNRECQQKHDISDMLPRPITYRCPTCGGYTSIYVSRRLSPEELAKYDQTSNTNPNKKTVFSLPNEALKNRKENVDMSKYPHITKELLESEFAAGKSGHQVEVEQNLPKGTISYHMKKHGVKSQFSNPANREKEPIPSAEVLPTNDTAARIIKAEVELSREKDTEIERLREELAKKIGELSRLKADKKDVIIRDQNSNVLTLHIPIINSGSDRFEQRLKVHEELNEMATEIEASNVDRRRALGELFDLIQSFAGLIRTELDDLLIGADIDDHLKQFFAHHNAEHITKIQQYAVDRGWTVKGAWIL